MKIFPLKRVTPTLALIAGGLPGWLAIAELLADPAVRRWSDVLLGLSEVAALLGAGLFAASFVLMLRVGWLARAFSGLDRLYFAHHLTGLSAFLSLLLHPVALGMGHLLAGDGALALAATVPSPGRPALFIGWIALLWLMAMLLASFHARLAYASWKWLHVTSGLAFLLALGHIVMVRPSFGWGHMLLAPWAAMGVAAFAYRALIEHGRAESRRYIVAEVTHLGDRVVELGLKPVDRPLAFEPGQFVFTAFDAQPGYHGCGEYHPFTIVSRPGEPLMRLAVKALGDCTTRMQALQPGVIARVQGPFGAFLRLAQADRPQVWIAGGIGITPFLSMLHSLADTGPPIDLYYAAAGRADATWLGQIERVVRRLPRLRLITAFADRGEILSADRIAANSGPLSGKEFFMCGPPSMVRDLSGQLRARGVPSDDIHAERFDLR
ncbi:MAG: ferric reductase-like transmembrane domain-containing protein [Pseudomonadota bacterium]